jgi:HEAT repeat protein
MFERPTGLSLEAALRDIEAASPRARVAAAGALARPAERRDEALAALRRATSDLRPEVRATACASLAEFAEPEAAEIVALCLDDGDAEVRQNAAIALGSLGLEPGFEPLAKALQSGPPDLRFQAATSLVEIDAERSFPALCDALEAEEDPEVQGALALALGAIGNKRCAKLIAPLLESEHSRTRLDAAYALADLDDPRAIEVLAAAARETEGSWDAVSALARLGSAGQSALAELVTKASGRSTSLILAAGAVLAQDPAHEASRAVLVHSLRARRLEHRGLAVQELGKLAADFALPALRTLRRSFKGRRLREDIDEAIAAIEERTQ